MAPNSANMSQHARSPEYACPPGRARAAFLAAQVDALLTGEPNPASPAASDPPAKKSSSKKCKSIASTRAKASLRASKTLKRKIETASDPDFEHHRRKCKICSHPEREAIEDLFIHWHSPESIHDQFGDYPPFDVSSIYRHARAAGLYARRSKNLRAVFDLLLEQADSVQPTAHGIVAVVRAYSCLTKTNQWVEPEKRVHIINNVYRHDAPTPSTTSAPGDASLAASQTSSAPAQSISQTAHVSTTAPQKSNASFSKSRTSNTRPPTSALPNRQPAELESPPTRT
ncbi:MAG: hypothetical protein WBE20_12665 [Candidatus Acidiferrales bacterium]